MVTITRTWKGDIGVVGSLILWLLGATMALLGALTAAVGAVMIGVCVVFMHKGARYTITALLFIALLYYLL